MQRGISLTAAALLAANLTPAFAQDDQPESGSGWHLKAPVIARQYMVATANPHASQVGYEVLRAGGNAIDAAVAVQLMLNLVEPQSSGIGGGAFLLYWDAKTRRLTTFDGRETAPAAAGPDYFLDPGGKPMRFSAAHVGGRSVGVPGTLKLLDMVHRRYGTQPWRDLSAPTIKLAEAGFAISPRLAKSIAGARTRGLDRFATARAYFFNPNGTPKTAGSLLANREFADTLRLIDSKGIAAFYEGDIGRDIVTAVRATPDNPGIMTLQDLARYRAIERAPVCQPYRGHSVCGMGPPSSGGLTVGQILGLLEHFDLAGMGHNARSVHLILESSKLAFADRALYMADADYVRMPTRGLLDPAYLKVRARQIDPGKAGPAAKAGKPSWRETRNWAPESQEERPGTSHFVIRDRFGNAVSMTTTIEAGFGSRVMVRGFLLNNELTDFSFRPELAGKPIANRVEGGKRPRSSMAPTIVLRNNTPVLLVGSPGGSRIISYVAKTLIAILDWQMSPQQAIDLGNFVNRNGPTDLEGGTPAAAMAGALHTLGHTVRLRNLNSGLQAIQIEPGHLIGGADPRREGLVIGD